jgi:hypothetical protein
MKRGILMICLAGGVAWNVTARADNSASAPTLFSQLQQTSLTNRLMLLKKFHHQHLPPALGMPGMPGGPPMAAAPHPTTPAPAGLPTTGITPDTAQSSSVSTPPSDPDNPYASIVLRNVFGLNPIPVVDPNAPPPGPPPPKITLTGITTIFGPAEALFTVAGVVREGRPPHDESYIFTEGESQDDVEVVSIDTKKNVVTFNNHGVQQDVPLSEATASSGSAPSAPSWPGQGFRRRFGRNFGGGSPFGGPGGGPGNFPPPSYQPQSYNNPQPNGYGGSSSSYNSANNSPSQPVLSADDQAAVIAAEHAQAVASDSPTAPLFPTTPYDKDAGVPPSGSDNPGDASPASSSPHPFPFR